MELISRDEAMRLLKEDLDASRSRGDDERADVCLFHYIEISNIPTIEERKEGHWIKQPSYKPFIDDETEITVAPKCSVCGKHGSFRNNYCQNCGAKMKGE